jgi:NADH-quinone oxidoreductase subunit H
MILFFIEMPVINGELLTPFLALTWIADPSRTLPIIKAFMKLISLELLHFQDLVLQH